MKAKTFQRSGVEASEQTVASIVPRFNQSTLTLSNRQHARKISLHRLKTIAAAALTELEIKHGNLEINLLGTAEMTRLNETFLRHRGSTDVITFDYLDTGRGIRSAALSLHGEIFVCVEEAILHARKFGTSWQSEIVRYIVHGLLHLLGHVDWHAGARRKMKREENRVLRELSRRFALSRL
jgi:probable rRNA maturation factor